MPVDNDLDLQKDAQRRAYLSLVETASNHWKDIFNRNPVYSTTYSRDLFVTLWRAGEDNQGRLVWVSISDAATYMPELKSLAGAKSFIARACADGFLEAEAKCFTKFKIEIDCEKVPKGERKPVPGVRLAPGTKIALDACFERCWLDVENAVGRIAPRLTEAA